MPSLDAWVADAGQLRRLRDGQVLGAGANLVHSPHLPFDVAPRDASKGWFGDHVMPNYAITSDDEHYELVLFSAVASQTALPTGLKLTDSGHSRRTSDTGKLWTWTGKAWIDQGPCPAYTTVGGRFFNPRDGWASVVPPANGLVTGGDGRDMPLPVLRHGGTEREFRRAFAAAEVRQAIAAGSDGFTLHIVQIGETSVHWPRAKDYVIGTEQVLAADKTPFSLILCPDCKTSGTASKKDANGIPLVNESCDALVTQLLTIAASPALLRIDGRLAVAPFAPETWPDRPDHIAAADWPTRDDRLAFWSRFKSRMAANGHPVYFIVPFLGDWTVLADDGWDPIVDCYSLWGARDEDTARLDNNRYRRAAWFARTRRGKPFMVTHAFGDGRPREGNIWFDGGWDTCDALWDSATGLPDGDFYERCAMVHGATWNDIPEGSNVHPSVSNGWAVLDYRRWGLERWKAKGVPPKIERDAIYLRHRDQFFKDTARPMTFTGLAKPGQTSPLLRQSDFIDTVKGLTPWRNAFSLRFFTVAPATAIISINGVDRRTVAVPAGWFPLDHPLENGIISVRLVRGGNVVARVTSTAEVSQTKPVQNLYPFSFSSLRQEAA